MMHLLLEPIDVWLFRDGRPFDAGSDHRAESLFPPYPSVVQGVIRSHQLVLQGVDLRDAARIRDVVGTADDLLDLRVRGPFVARREADGRVMRYFPQPADAVSIEAQPDALRRASLPSRPGDGLITSAPTLELLGLEDESVKGPSARWLREDELRRYLAGDTAATVQSDTLFMKESRFGIGVDSTTRTTWDGALYEAEFIRPCKDVGMLVEVDGYDGWPTEGLLRLGGEARGASFKQVTAEPWPMPPDPLPDRFAVFFATPTLFDGGWQPAFAGWDRFFEGKVKPLAAAVGRYDSIGGFDLAAGSHKPARRHVPAGSVYYFAATEPARLRPDLIGRAITDHGAAMGFGQILIGKVTDV